MKKLSLIAFCLVLTLLLAACTVTESAQKTKPSETTAEITSTESQNEAAPAESTEAAATAESKETAGGEASTEAPSVPEPEETTTTEESKETAAAAETEAANDENEDIVKKSKSYEELNDDEPVQEVLVTDDGSFLFQGWTIKNWEAFLAQEEKPILIDFWASWCGPCKQASPDVDKIAADYAGKVRVLKINVDYAEKIAQNYHFSGIPAFYLIHKSEKVNMWMGFTDTTIERIRANLDKLVN